MAFWWQCQGRTRCEFLEEKLSLSWGNFAWPACKNLTACGICAIHIFIPTAQPSKKPTSPALLKIFLQNPLCFQKDKVVRTVCKTLPWELPLLLPEDCGTHFSILWLAYFIPVLVINSILANWSLWLLLPIYTAGHRRVKYHLRQHRHPSL